MGDAEVQAFLDASAEKWEGREQALSHLADHLKRA